MEALPRASERRVCRVLEVSRTSVRYTPRQREEAVDEVLADRIRRLIHAHPTFGYRRLWALLRADGVRVNQKAVYRILRVKGWFVNQRIVTPRP